MSFVDIHYARLPDRTTIFRQQLIHRTEDCIVTLMPRTPLAGPIRAGGAIILEPDAPAVWFTFPGCWHDIGRFHTADGRFTGYYANVLTPVRFHSTLEWETTDLFLDVWVDAHGSVQLLDEDELDAALAHAWIDTDVAAAARAEATRLLDAARAGEWPPAIVREWTLQRALETGRHSA